MRSKNLIGIFAASIFTAILMVAMICGEQGALTQLSLQDLGGNHIEPLKDSKKKAVVFIFTRIDCPISNRYAPEVRRLRTKFVGGGVKFWLVYPDATESADTIRRHIKEYEYDCDALRDPKHELVRMTGVSVTPEAAVFIIDRSVPRMIYRGRLDDRYYAFGKYRPAPTVSDLEDVLESVVNRKPVKFRTTSAVGCYISDLK